MKSWKATGVLVAAGIGLLAARPSHASMMAYMSVTGQKQGEMKGSITQRGREGKIGVIAISHTIVSPRDPQSGLPTGQRQHKPFIVTVEWDAALTKLYQALCTNETLTSVTIDYWEPQIKAGTGVGAEINSFTIKLTNANIASIDSRMFNIRDADLQKRDAVLEIAFTYQNIEWTAKQTGTTTRDGWSAQVEAPAGKRRPLNASAHARPRQTADKARPAKRATRVAANAAP